MEAAYQRCNAGHRWTLDDIYRLRIEACQFLGLAEEAKKTALAGVKHFAEVGRSPDFNPHISWLYGYCVADALGPGEEKQALAICDAYAGLAREHPERFDDWVRISAKREEFRAKVAGKPRPDMGILRLIEGTAANNNSNLRSIRMAATEGKVWFVPAQWSTGLAMLWQHKDNTAESLHEVGCGATCVAATQDAVFFGSGNGFYKFDLRGKLVKQYGRDDPSFPGHRILDVCEGHGKIYFAFQGSPLRGVAMFDPATEKMSVLAPSRREASSSREPVSSLERLQWDTVTPRLYACGYFGWSNNPRKLVRVYGWSPQDKGWQPYQIDSAPRLVVSYGNETLLVRTVGDQTEFQFVKGGQKLMAALPAPSLIGDPAWDEHRIWVPTSSGLYEVDRATAQVRWLAYEDGNRFLSLLRHGNWLYVATAHGLYYGAISPTGLIRPPTAPSTPADLRPRPTVAATVNRRATRTTLQEVGPATGSTVIPLELSLENNADATIAITAGKQQRLKNAHPGTVQLDVAALKNGVHYLYFHCPGYAAQWVRIELVDGKTVSNRTQVKLFRTRYVILRCALNTNGGRKLVGDDMNEQHLALSHWTGPEYFFYDWQVWQGSNGAAVFGDTPYLQFHRYAPDFGFARPGPGVSYENMKEAPATGYRCENIKAEKGLLLYCRVNGGAGKAGFGYGKVLVEAVTETPPNGIRVVDSPWK
jgi:hypothetical protein